MSSETEVPSEPTAVDDHGAVGYCAHCDRNVELASPAELDSARCPTCGGELVLDDTDAPPKAPWHFKVLLVGTAGYLVYRLIWFIFWLAGHAWHG